MTAMLEGTMLLAMLTSLTLAVPRPETLLQGPDGRGGEEGVSQGGGADEQHPLVPGRLQVRKGPGSAGPAGAADIGGSGSIKSYATWFRVPSLTA